MLFAGSLVFQRPSGPVHRRNIRNWWFFVKGADWRHPQGPVRTSRAATTSGGARGLRGRDGIRRVGRQGLPTEAEWELAARGGLVDTEFAWGDTLHPEGRAMANTWQGEFPWKNTLLDGYEGTSPVDAFPPTVRDQRHDRQRLGVDHRLVQRCPSRRDAQGLLHAPQPQGAPEEGSFDPTQPAIRIPRKVIKGGSHLCAPSYCRRYRPAARFPEPVDTSTSHLGLRCVVRHQR